MAPSAVEPNISWTTFHNIIDGNRRGSEQSHHGIDPVTRDELWSVPVATMQDLEDAVSAAARAFETWKMVPFNERRERLRVYRELWVQHSDGMASLLSKETGKPSTEAKGEVAGCTGLMDWYISLKEPEDREEDDEKIIVTRYSPLGVVAAICPWNFPLSLAFYKIAPALLAGNVVIVKPSPFTPYTTLKAAELAQQVFPPGVFQAIGGDKAIGPALTAHTGIAKIAFTGSTAAGKKIMEACAKTLKRVTLELGGNDAAIVLPDVDIEEIAPKVAMSAFFTSGQVCVATRRLFIHEEIYAPFLEALVRFTKTIKEGLGMGPMQNAMQFDKIKKTLADGKAQGLQFAVGGEDTRMGKSYFIEPTIIDNPPGDATILQEEPFGPVLSCLRWRDEHEVIARANDTKMGLAGTVWSKNVEHAQRIAWKLDTGTIYINAPVRPTPQAPFGGHKESGIGAEGGKNGLLAYYNTHVVLHYK